MAMRRDVVIPSYETDEQFSAAVAAAGAEPTVCRARLCSAGSSPVGSMHRPRGHYARAQPIMHGYSRSVERSLGTYRSVGLW